MNGTRFCEGERDKGQEPNAGGRMINTETEPAKPLVTKATCCNGWDSMDSMSQLWFSLASPHDVVSVLFHCLGVIELALVLE